MNVTCTPAELEKAGKRKWLAFLHAHRLWRADSADHRLEIFARATTFSGGASAVAAKSLLAVSLARLLRTLESQLELYRIQIESAFARQPDHDLFGSLPGAGPKLASRLLAELGDDRERFSDPQALQSYAGTAPVTIQSGKTSYQKMRHACNDTLRATVHLWVDNSRHRCAWAQAYYQAHRAKGQSHSCALRCLGQRWLKILWKMWQSRTSYDESLHMRNQVAHGSWLLSLNASASAK